MFIILWIHLIHKIHQIEAKSKSPMKQSFFLAAAAFFCICAALPQSLSAKHTTLVWGREADALSLDPAIAVDAESSRVIANIYEGLVAHGNDSTKVVPALAYDWTISPDNRVWTFFLRKGVRFHDGTPFNADAVVFSFMRQIDPDHPYHEDAFIYSDVAFQYVKQVVKVDDFRVQIILTRPYAPFLSNLAIQHAFPIVSPSAVRKQKEAFGRHPVGTGPFKFSEWIDDDRIVLTKWEKYWDVPAKIERLVIKTIPNAKNRLLALKTGAIHGMNGVDQETMQQIESPRNKDLKLVVKPGRSIVYMAMNLEKPPFHLQKVRQAVNYAINKPKLVKLIYGGTAIVAANPLPPSFWGYHHGISDYGYAPEKAKKLLAEAGFENGFSTNLFYSPRPAYPSGIERIIRANLGAVGIHVDIINLDWKTHLEMSFKGVHDMCILGWVGDNGDPDSILYPLFDKEHANPPKATNRAFYKNEELHEILLKAQTNANRGYREEMYIKAQKIIHTDAPWVPLVHTREMIALHKKVQGVILQPSTDVIFHYAWIEQ